MASITLLFPLPLGPTTAVKLCKEKIMRRRKGKSRVETGKLKRGDNETLINRETDLVERTDPFLTGIGLEIPHHHLLDKEPRFHPRLAVCAGVRGSKSIALNRNPHGLEVLKRGALFKRKIEAVNAKQQQLLQLRACKFQ